MNAINVNKIIKVINIGFINNDFAQLRAQLSTFPSTFVLPVSAVPSAVTSAEFEQ